MPITTIDYVKDILDYTNSTYDTLIKTLIPVVEDDFLKIRGKDFDLDNENNIEYPVNASFIAAKMIGFLIGNKTVSMEMKSESIGSYSYTRNNKKGGYPNDIINQIEVFQSMQ